MQCPNGCNASVKGNPDEPHLSTCTKCGLIFHNVDDFRTYIKEQVKRQGITIYALAKAAGLRSRITLYNYLRGADMRTSNLTKVLEALKNITSAK